MTIIVVDVEADGPIPYKYSMISLGAVVLDDKLDKTFFTTIEPISDVWIPEALAVSGYTREETLQFRKPIDAMTDFNNWLKQVSDGKLMFFSDNNGFD